MAMTSGSDEGVDEFKGAGAVLQIVRFLVFGQCDIARSVFFAVTSRYDQSQRY